MIYMLYDIILQFKKKEKPSAGQTEIILVKMTTIKLVFAVLCISFYFIGTVYQCHALIRFPNKIQFSQCKKLSFPIASMNDERIDDTFTQKQILKEETEAPFRKVRIFFYISLLSAAGLGTLICTTKLLAILLQSRSTENINDLYTNLGINLAGIPVLGYLWKRDLDKQKGLLERISKGGSLAGLKIKFRSPAGPLSLKLSDLRRDRGIDKRVVIVIAEKESLLNSLQTSVSQSFEMLQNDLVVVPVVIEQGTNKEFTLSAPTLDGLYLPEGTAGTLEDNLEHIGLPISLSEWNNVLKREISTALSQDSAALKKGVTIIIKKNGKVGTRRFGVPLWESIVGDVALRSELGLDIRNI